MSHWSPYLTSLIELAGLFNSPFQKTWSSGFAFILSEFSGKIGASGNMSVRTWIFVVQVILCCWHFTLSERNLIFTIAEWDTDVLLWFSHHAFASPLPSSYTSQNGVPATHTDSLFYLLLWLFPLSGKNLYSVQDHYPTVFPLLFFSKQNPKSNLLWCLSVYVLLLLVDE